MSFQRPIFRTGDSPVFDQDVSFGVDGAARRADTFDANENESLASITERAYGVNTPEFRERIERANANLKGTINVPRY
ncbi:hypothetical protein SEA_LUZDEMUNDO_22 [Microbacterium phage LuzDeMundo]|nr:hypothetical protein SEA_MUFFINTHECAT_22 [Microbacterium phage MuffinTheCat]QWY84675.1 hypothetical protein SEA_BADULIA_22 [Microbacterium phage Badulia]UJQ86513.1 hypothetical protein SEA_DESIREEROSE_22 [Microbacterium phage DesireeRose]UVG34198.1 hypothetical protein SEA_LUZDEMUNDO_22 [Microbacterium phage LuzDeMundo]WGH20702.1 hypothetical protein SEA_SCOUPSA_22 [Microbacterium phage SCoupsA]WGH21165.1 hypothetical protein SEA_BEE17_23 [Microbacterium phage Bee17]